MRPSYLGDRDTFETKFTKVIKSGRSKDCSESERIRGEEAEKRLNKMLEVVHLRRTKEDDFIKHQLPKKVEKVVFCKLSERQIEIYSRLLNSYDAGIILDPNHPLILELEEDEEVIPSRLDNETILYRFQHPLHMDPDGVMRRVKCGHRACPRCQGFALLNLLRKLSNHLDLVRIPKGIVQEGDDTRKSAAMAEYLFGESDSRINPMIQSTDSYLEAGKVMVLKAIMIKVKKENGKLLLFSRSTAVLDILQMAMTQWGYTHCRLDGSTKNSDRQRLVDEFNSKPNLFVFLISTKAGGLGLNLQSANTVVIFDPWYDHYLRVWVVQFFTLFPIFTIF